MTTKTIIPAQPGWFIVDEEDGTIAADAIIAWECEVLPPNQSSVGIATPIALGGGHIYGLNGILQPNGRVYVDVDVTYECVDDFIEDSEDRRERYQEARRRVGK